MTRETIEAALRELGADWQPDIVAPGTPHEEWSGKWFRTVGSPDRVHWRESTASVERPPFFARAIAEIVNSAPVLLAELNTAERQLNELRAELERRATRIATMELALELLDTELDRVRVALAAVRAAPNLFGGRT